MHFIVGYFVGYSLMSFLLWCVSSIERNSACSDIDFTTRTVEPWKKPTEEELVTMRKIMADMDYNKPMEPELFTLPPSFSFWWKRVFWSMCGLIVVGTILKAVLH